MPVISNLPVLAVGDQLGIAEFLKLTIARYWYRVHDAANYKLPAVGDLFGTAEFLELALYQYRYLYWYVMPLNKNYWYLLSVIS
jgi:hypothetical protein